MSSNQSAPSEEEDLVRDIHALTPPRPQRSNSDARSSSSSTLSNFSTMSREFNALVVAGTNLEIDVHNRAGAGAGAGARGGGDGGGYGNDYNLAQIGEEEETNPLAIVPDNTTPMNPMSRSDHLRPLDPVPSPQRSVNDSGIGSGSTTSRNDVTVHQVKKEEIESKIYAWQSAKISKINNRFKREDAVINGWEGEEVQKATSVMKKVERKLEEKRAKALEKMQNDIAKAHRKAEEKRASAEAKRGTKVARVLEIANLMRTLGRPPAKRSFF